MVQAACIPLALTGRDICGSAVTGEFLQLFLHLVSSCAFPAWEDWFSLPCTLAFQTLSLHGYFQVASFARHSRAAALSWGAVGQFWLPESSLSPCSVQLGSLLLVVDGHLRNAGLASPAVCCRLVASRSFHCYHKSKVNRVVLMSAGSGKTAAFALPLLERLLYRPKRVAAIYALVLTPTRELAVQVPLPAAPAVAQSCHQTACSSRGLKQCLVGFLHCFSWSGLARDMVGALHSTP